MPNRDLTFDSDIGLLLQTAAVLVRDLRLRGATTVRDAAEVAGGVHPAIADRSDRCVLISALWRAGFDVAGKVTPTVVTTVDGEDVRVSLRHVACAIYSLRDRGASMRRFVSGVIGFATRAGEDFDEPRLIELIDRARPYRDRTAEDVLREAADLSRRETHRSFSFARADEELGLG